MSLLYYLNILLLWIFCIVFTLYCSVNSGEAGLGLAILACLILIPCGILCIRTILEISYSVLIIREKFSHENIQLLNEKRQDLEIDSIENSSEVSKNSERSNEDDESNIEKSQYSDSN